MSDWAMRRADATYRGFVNSKATPPLRMVWKAKTPEPNHGLAYRGKYFCKTYKHISCYDLKNGSEYWTYKIPKYCNFLWSDMLAFNDRIFVNHHSFDETPSSILICLNAKTGEVTPKVPLSDGLDVGQRLGVHKDCLVFASGNAGFSLDKLKIETKKAFYPQSTVYRMASQGNRCAIAGDNGISFWQLGRKKWQVPHKSIHHTSDLIIDSDLTLFRFSSKRARTEFIWIVNSRTGDILSKIPVKGMSGEGSSGAFHNGLYFMPTLLEIDWSYSNKGCLACYDSSKGNELWRKDDITDLAGCAPVITPKWLFWCGRSKFPKYETGWVVALEPTSGKEVWRHEFGSWPEHMVLTDGHLVVTARKMIYAFEATGKR